MFDLNTALAAWRRTLENNPAFTTDDLDELEQHLRDEVHAQSIRGVDEETAYRQALQQMGPYGAVEAAYQEVFWQKARRTGGLGAALSSRLQLWRTYGRLAWRNLRKDPLSASINVVGFATALACCLVVFVYLQQQARLDTFHADVDRIFQVQQTLAEPTRGKLRLGTTPMPLGPILATDFQQVEAAVRVQQTRASVQIDGSLFDAFPWFVDPDFLHLFTFPLQYGDPNALADPQQIVLSHLTAERFFGAGVDPVGQTVVLTFGEQHSRAFTVGGVAAPFPNNRAFAFTMLVPFAQQRMLGLRDLDDWGTPVDATFLRIRDRADLPGLAQQLAPYLAARQQVLAAREAAAPVTAAFTFEHLPDIGKNEEEVIQAFIGGSGLAEIVFMVVLALIILVLASTNYVNIAIVSASRRIKEIGIRKVVGGRRGQLVAQFLLENAVLCFLALVGGVVLAKYVLLPGFTNLFPPEAPVFALDLLGNGPLWGFLAGLLVFVAVLSGGYPALYIARFEPVVIFRGRERFGRRSPILRGLLVFQLVVTFIALILPIADAEHQRAQVARDWGYTADHLIVAPLPTTASYGVLADQLRQLPDVAAVAGARHHLGARQGTGEVTVAGRTARVLFYDVGEGYAEALGLRLQQGRLLDAPGAAAVLVNEAFVADMGWTEPLGQEVLFGGTTYEVAGVLDNALRRRWADDEPHLYRLTTPDAFRYLIVQAQPGTEGRVGRALEAAWQTLYPERPYAGFYQTDVFADRSNDMDPFRFLGFLTLLLSCIGNLGLIALHVAQRRKEISIRKVMGASPLRIVRLVLRSFLWQMGLAFVIAGPLAYWLLVTLMQNRVAEFGLSPWPFVLVVALMLGTLLLTLSVQLVKATRTNPVEALRVG